MLLNTSGKKIILLSKWKSLFNPACKLSRVISQLPAWLAKQTLQSQLVSPPLETSYDHPDHSSYSSSHHPIFSLWKLLSPITLLFIFDHLSIVCLHQQNLNLSIQLSISTDQCLMCSWHLTVIECLYTYMYDCFSSGFMVGTLYLIRGKNSCITQSKNLRWYSDDSIHLHLGCSLNLSLFSSQKSCIYLFIMSIFIVNKYQNDILKEKNKFFMIFWRSSANLQWQFYMQKIYLEFNLGQARVWPTTGSPNPQSETKHKGFQEASLPGKRTQCSKSKSFTSNQDTAPKLWKIICTSQLKRRFYLGYYNKEKIH